MKVLFIHQNFPGQYLHLAQHLRSLGHEVAGLGETANIKRRGAIPGITTVGYATPKGAGQETHHYLLSTEASVRRGQAAARSLLSLKEKGFKPDVISVHPGWGEGLFVRDIFPDAPILMFCEYFFHTGEADLAFDPEFPSSADNNFSIRVRNAPQALSLITADACISPTQWQASRYPAGLCKNLHVIHDGVNTAYMCPGEDSLTLEAQDTPGEYTVVLPETKPNGATLTLTRKDKLITYIGRNLEPYRGFHVFLRALPELQKHHPDARVLIVGNTGVSYSPHLPEGQTYKAKYLEELAGKLDLSRIHFLNHIPYAALRSLFRISSAHVYLTYPFVLSWSVLEAMACEALVIASKTEPVTEVIGHKDNGLLVDFFKQEELLGAIDKALAAPGDFMGMRKKARQTVVRDFELGACLNKQTRLLEAMVNGVYKGAWRKSCPVLGEM